MAVCPIILYLNVNSTLDIFAHFPMFAAFETHKRYFLHKEGQVLKNVNQIQSS